MPTLQQSTIYPVKGQATQTGAFGANGKAPQTAATVNAAASNAAGNPPTQTEFNALVALVNQLRAALVANGICQ